MARIKKVLNTSVVLVIEKNDEFIVLGKGIGYGKKPGELIDTDNNEYQTFISVDDKKKAQLSELVNSIPVEIIDITIKLIEIAEQELNTILTSSLAFILADHINFAIEREKKGIIITNKLIWEIKNLYAKEYKIASKCVEIINKELQTKFTESEVANIAFHIVNAEASANPNYDGQRYARLVGEIVRITSENMDIIVETESIHYNRFITHIKFFVERFFTDRMLKDNDTSLIPDFKFRKEKEIVFKIKNYLMNAYNKEIPDEEVLYLVVHISRLLRK